MTAVGNVPDVPWNVMPLCSCHIVRLPKKALFAPKKSGIGRVHSNNKCNGILVIVIFEKHLIGRCKTQCFSWAVV